MKIPVVALIIVAASVPALVLGQASATKHVILSPKSNLDTASVSEGFAKYCLNVAVTENEARADYVLEASSRTDYSDGDSYSRWHFTLLNKDGDVLMTTHPEAHFRHRFKHHFESVCKYFDGK
ncbi:MAG: hypothetical protein WAL56_14625 [Candidatus Sulfotelmatobacter sp.]